MTNEVMKNVPTQFSESDVKRLRADLNHARRTVLLLVTQPFRQVLESHIECDSMDEYHAWRGRAADRLLQLVSPRPARGIEGGSLSPRTKCPLCDDQANTFGAEGFAFPEGLLRHLLGSHNANPCPVFETASALARESAFVHERREEAMPR